MPLFGFLIRGAYLCSWVPITRSPDHARSPDLKGMFQIRALRRKQLRAVFRHVPIIFQSDAKFAANINPWLVAEGQIWGQRQSVSTNQIRPLMAVHTDPMSHSMRKVFVVRAVTGVGDYFARGGVDSLTLDARFCRSQRR